VNIYAIGDIHGCLTPLKTIFENTNFNKDDIFVFLGDYVDRGNNSKGVIDFLIELRKNKTCYFLKGNHEILMSQARTNNNNLIKWLYYGGSQTLDSYNIGDVPDWINLISDEHWKFIENGLPYKELNGKIFVHSGLKPSVDLDKQTDEDLYWNIVAVPQKYSDNKIVICGHNSQPNGEIANFGHTVYIDTFAHGGQWLTFLNVETGDVIKANNLGEIKKEKITIADNI